MDNVRLATAEEIETMKDHSDLQFATQVYSYGDARAVYRLAPELDPVDFGTLSNNSKRTFLAFLETHMRLSGVPAYYFNVSSGPEMEQYRKVVENWGAVPTGQGPEIRYKKTL